MIRALGLASALLLGATALAGEPHGWRADGTNVFSGARPLTHVDTSKSTVWSLPLAWSNASPVALGSLVCTTVEPIEVVCVDAATGKVRWRAQNSVIDAMPASDQAAMRTRVTEADAAEVRLRASRQEFSSVQRDLRRSGGDPALTARAAALADEMSSLKALIDGVVLYRTPPDREIIGYASATPASDGTSLYVLFGNGVVASYDAAGKRRWIRWLGAPQGVMRGYHLGTTASPQLVDGLLVVPWNQLTALDPATGAVRWTGPEFRDYGTPAVVRAGADAFVLTPDGRAVRARDGAVVLEKLGNIWYVGPVVSGQDVYFVGSTSDGHNTTSHGDVAKAIAWRVASDGKGGITVTKKWSLDLPTRNTYYAQPVLFDGRLYAVSNRGELLVVDAASGAVQGSVDLGELSLGVEVFASPVIAGRTLVLMAANGRVITSPAGASPSPATIGQVGTIRATPVFTADRVWLRTYDALRALRVE